MDGKYVRVYYSILDDPKFDGVRSNAAILGTWLRLLMSADAVWPASADIPRGLSASHVRVLVECGLVDGLRDHRFRIHGLDAERNARSIAGRNAAALRWHSGPNADPMPSKAEQRQDEQSRVTPPPFKGKRENGTNARAIGTNPRANGMSPRQERQAEKRQPASLADIIEGMSKR